MLYDKGETGEREVGGKEMGRERETWGEGEVGLHLNDFLLSLHLYNIIIVFVPSPQPSSYRFVLFLTTSRMETRLN